jgi:hypothetical protein
MENVTLREYWDLLNRHDWYYVMSDDSSAYYRGERSEDILSNFAKLSEAHAEMFNNFKGYHLSRINAKIEYCDKPVKP